MNAIALPAEPDPFDVRDALRQIGRGREGARALPRDAAHALFDALFAGRLGEAETGAVLIALRMKGESLEELEGAMDALQAHLRPVPVDAARPVVSLPAYNGARLLPNLVPLLAGLLADAGVQVILHGVVSDPARTTTADVARALGHAPQATHAAAATALRRGAPAFLPLELLSPALARVLALRERLGVRNIGHTLAKLLDPTGTGRCLRVVPFTHPEFDRLQHDYFLRTGAPALVMRGTEGEPVASLKRPARIDFLHAGACRTLVEAQPGPMRDAGSLPPARDACATALWIQSVLAGERPVPEPVAAQVDAVMRALDAVHA